MSVKSIWINASAGSGKTYQIVQRYLTLLSNNIHPVKVLCITFTNNAATEMKSRILEKLQEKDQISQNLDPFKHKNQFNQTNKEQDQKSIVEKIEKYGLIKTIHSFCYEMTSKRVIDQYQRQVFLDKSLNIALDNLEFKKKFSELLKFYSVLYIKSELYDFDDCKNKKDNELKQKNNKMQNKESHQIKENPDHTPEDKNIFIFLQRIIKDKYYDLTKDLIYYDDIIKNAIQSFKDPSVYHYIHNIEHLVIDEAQDLNEDQWEFIVKLYEEIKSSILTASIFVVGDEKQVIYQSENLMARYKKKIDEIHEKYDSEPIQQVELSKSYRSNQAVLDFVNKTFDKTSGFPKHISNNRDITGSAKLVECDLDSLNKHLLEILLSDSNKHFTILTSKRNILLKKIEETLDKSKIEYNSCKKVFLSDIMISAIILIKYFYNPKEAFLRSYICKHIFKKGDLLFTLSNLKGIDFTTKSELNFIRDPKELFLAKKFHSLYKKLLSANLSARDILATAMRISGLSSYAKEQVEKIYDEYIEVNSHMLVQADKSIESKTGQDNQVQDSKPPQDSIQDSKPLTKVTYEYEKKNTDDLTEEASLDRVRSSSIVDFIHYIERSKLVFQDITLAKRISIMTIHSSKGLEFENVILVDKDLDENLLYVGLTRAKKEIYFLKITPKDNIKKTITSSKTSLK